MDELFRTVVNNDYCIGCGVCAGLTGSPLKMKLNSDGKYVPERVKEKQESFETNILAICPFSNESKDESIIGSSLYENVEGIKHSEYTGWYLKKFAGYVKADSYRERGSSGGTVTWLAVQLLKQDMVDAVIHVKNSGLGQKSTLFNYQISKTADELFEGAKSKYYPVEMSEVIKYVRDNPARYALVGIPCFIKSIRLLAQSEERIKNSIRYTIGLVCGHLKTDMFAKSLAWQMGIKPSELTAIDFRMKIQGMKASSYGVEASGIVNGTQVKNSAPTNRLHTTDWGQGLFKYNACDYCDDVLAETADVTIGDAWLPEYVKDSEGTNIIIIRNADLMKIFEQSKADLFLEDISIAQVFESQSGGFRHRHEGTAYRLYLKDQAGEWRPEKRTKASAELISKRKKVYEARLTLNKESYRAYEHALQKDDFNVFVDHMEPYTKEYKKLQPKTFLQRGFKKIKRMISK